MIHSRNARRADVHSTERRDPVSREVIVRWEGDSYFVEIPNSENERTARSLHVCDLLPTTLVKVSGV